MDKAAELSARPGEARGVRRYLRPNLLLAIALIAALVAIKLFIAEDVLKSILRWIAGLGVLAPLIFVGLYVAAAVLFIPGSILSLGAGAVFGLVRGAIYVSAGATIGATCAFLIGRYIAREWVEKKLESNPRFKAIDQAVAKEGWKIVGLMRLSPVFPFNLLNYAFGLTEIPLKDYFFATWIGMIPGIILYVYIGSLAGDVARIGNRPEHRSSPQWVMEIAGLLATLAVTVYVTYLARAALRKRTMS